MVKISFYIEDIWYIKNISQYQIWSISGKTLKVLGGYTLEINALFLLSVASLNKEITLITINKISYFFI